DVEVDDADTSHTGGGEVHRSRRSETTRADAKDTSGFQLLLSVDADLRHDEMPRVPFDLVGVQLSRRSGADPWVRGFRRSPTRHRRHDAQRVARLDRRLLPLQVADVFVVQIDVDKV